ncbi:MAG: glycogen-binding domain-containing protein [bacterium]
MAEKVQKTNTRAKKTTTATKKVTKKVEKSSNNGSVEFAFYSPEAKDVYLSGEFNNWDVKATPMKKNKSNYWKTKIALSPGRYEYKFFADGKWVEDVPNVEKASNPFGTPNFVINVE